ncbi:hypothetical protein ACN2MM_13240 [Alkalilimnicola ehrlichii MLHE-1]|uniref:Uncharacterized protein n=1 Tax=Alkalilimnicola ehrlichii (strain ATCC BAA-1101 / DSM 17681 / MLHE-1) TaxID=187272 RepID=Q0A5Q2_ALKEH|nr:hypothetical protein [Alkalilimnicola ehrlichii]ABI57835.1 conserved hypothetical protein [Alkalilimnicola ehrlichii MLHE-1]
MWYRIVRPPPGLSEEDRARHPSWRRTTRHYRRKQRRVRDLWIGAGLLMILAPVTAIPAILLGTVLAAFTILDETP